MNMLLRRHHELTTDEGPDSEENPSPESGPEGTGDTEVSEELSAEQVGAGETPESGEEPPAEDAPAEESYDEADAAEPSTAHGDIERPAGSGSTAAWRDYAAADPEGYPGDAATDSRDTIRDHYTA